MDCQPRDATAQPATTPHVGLARAARRARARAPAGARDCASSTSRASEDLPDPETPVITVKRPQGNARIDLAQIVQRRAADLESRACRASTGRRRERECVQRRRQAAAGGGIAQARELRCGALRHQAAAARAGAGAQIDHVIGAADRVLVVLDHDQRIALGAQPVQRVEQRHVVARVQADGGLVEHVAHALQVRAELRGEADALRLAAGQRRRGAIRAADSRGRHRTETRCARSSSASRSRAMSRSRPSSLNLAQCGGEFLHRQVRERGDRLAAKQHVQRHGIEPFAGAVRAQLRTRRPRRASVSRHSASSPLCSASKSRQCEPGAEAALAPAMPRVEREQARIEFREAGAAVRAGALGGEHARRCAQSASRRRVARAPRRGRAAAPWPAPRAARPRCAALTLSDATGNSMLCSTKRSSRGHFAVGSKLAVDAQLREALAARPFGERRIQSLARDDERRQQA